MEKQIAYLTKIQNRNNDVWSVVQGGYWHNRIVTELLFAAKLSQSLDGRYDESIFAAVDALRVYMEENGAITKAIVWEIEESLRGFSSVAKEYTIICAAHAHIDMNWMWGTAETAAITLDTFRTMLDLMNEYPEFTFSQSQASVYEIAEKYDPDMLEEIKRRVKENRWEPVASTWVETDKNMPNGESLSRHILYTKAYMKELFGLENDALTIDYEPDTFGHNLNVPEILAKGGVKYYYHCRGFQDHILYRYKSPSGSEILVYREPQWYLGAVDPSFLLSKADYFSETKIKTGLKVYGVGNHGGGPTRRDIERISDMNTWPLVPHMKFGTYAEFFAAVEPFRQQFPVVEKELNFVFDGCYTSQSRIKAANRIGENRLYQAETLQALSSAFCGGNYHAEYYREAWKNVLFNHFHDILPGSGVVDTREAARGMFQDTLARCNTGLTKALRQIVSKIDTRRLIDAEDISETVSEGAGVGFYTSDYVIPAAERGKGVGRMYHVFNSTADNRTALAEIYIWDWPGARDRMRLTDANGNELRFQIVRNGQGGEETGFWGHAYIQVLVEVTVGAFGYETVVLHEMPVQTVKAWYPGDMRVIGKASHTLENSRIKAVFHPVTMELMELVDHASGKNGISGGKGAGLKVVHEDPSKGMTAWMVGSYSKFEAIEDIRITDTHIDKTALRQWIKYSGTVGQSKITVTVSLDAGKASVDYILQADWFEKGDRGTSIPQLNYSVALGYESQGYLYDIPFGVIRREAMPNDVPGLSFVCAENRGASSVAIITKTKYGFRAYDNTISVSLLRSSFDPDPYPEIGMHTMEFSVGFVNAETNSGLLRESVAYNYAFPVISGSVHDGNNPAAKSFIREIGGVMVSALKMSEYPGSKKMILRIYEADGLDTEAEVCFATAVKSARFVDINEKPIGGTVTVEGNRIVFPVGRYSMATVEVEAEE